MLFADPADPDPLNAVQVNSFKEKPLVFDTLEQCHTYVKNNIDPLKAFALIVFQDKPDSLVKQIFCIPSTSNSV